MQIIATDNLNRETVSEKVVAKDITDQYANEVAAFLNSKYCTSDNSPWFFVVRPADYVPYTFEP